jgi:hypothetical protein
VLEIWNYSSNYILDVPIPEELKHDYGFAPLPKKFNTLVTLFNEMEKVCKKHDKMNNPFAHIRFFNMSMVENSAKLLPNLQQMSKRIAKGLNSYLERVNKFNPSGSSRKNTWRKLSLFTHLPMPFAGKNQRIDEPHNLDSGICWFFQIYKIIRVSN